MSLDRKTLFEIWLNSGLNLTMSRGTQGHGINAHHESHRLMKMTYVEWGSQKKKKKENSNKHDDSLSCCHIS